MDLWTIWDLLPLWLRKVLWGIFGVASLIGLPIGGFLMGKSIVDTNVAGRSSWRSAADARAGQWPWPVGLCIAGLVVGVVIFVIAVLYILKAKGDKRSAWR